MAELLRIPGIGPRSAKRIVWLRRENRFRSVEDLARIGVVTKRALPYILVEGKKYSPPLGQAGRDRTSYSQTSLWGEQG